MLHIAVVGVSAMQDKIVRVLKGQHYWKVTLEEKVGEVTIRPVYRHVPAWDRAEAAKKALIQHMLKNKGSFPRIIETERENYDRPIQI